MTTNTLHHLFLEISIIKLYVVKIEARKQKIKSIEFIYRVMETIKNMNSYVNISGFKTFHSTIS